MSCAVIQVKHRWVFYAVIQVCKTGKVKLLDMLIYYGADVNAQNQNGNTPLHICAAEDQVSQLLVLSATIITYHFLSLTI